MLGETCCSAACCYALWLLLVDASQGSIQSQAPAGVLCSLLPNFAWPSLSIRFIIVGVLPSMRGRDEGEPKRRMTAFCRNSAHPTSQLSQREGYHLFSTRSEWNCFCHVCCMLPFVLCRLLFEVYPKALQFHLPDDRMLQSHVSLDSAASTESVLSEGDIRGIVISEGATTEAPAGDGGKKHKHHGIFSKKPKHRKLRKRTLRRMVVAVQPEGWEVRRRANLVKAAKKLGKWSAVLLVGASLGWLVGEGKRRRGSSRQHVLARSHSNKKQEHGKLNKSSVGAAFEKARHAVGHV